MDLVQLKPSVAPLEIMHPTLGATGIILNLVGQDTKEFRDKVKQIAKFATLNKAKDLDIDMLEQQNLELVAACIVGWTGLEEDGIAIPFSTKKAFEIISDPAYSIVKEQVEVFVANRKNFFRKPGEAT